MLLKDLDYEVHRVSHGAKFKYTNSILCVMGIEVKSALVLSTIIVSLAVVGGLTISSPNYSMAIAPTVIEILTRLTVTENNVADVFIKIGDIKGEVIDTQHKVGIIQEDVDDIFIKIGTIKGEVIDTQHKVGIIQGDIGDIFIKVEDLQSEVDIVKNSILDATKIYQTSETFTLSKTLTKFTVQATCDDAADIILSAGIGSNPGFIMESSDPISSNSWEFGLKNTDNDLEGTIIIIAKATCIKLSP